MKYENLIEVSEHSQLIVPASKLWLTPLFSITVTFPSFSQNISCHRTEYIFLCINDNSCCQYNPKSCNARWR